MAPCSCARPLQLLRSTRKSGQPRQVPGTGPQHVVARSVPSQSKAWGDVGTHDCDCQAVAPFSTRAPPLSRATLRRQSSEIRAACASERSCGFCAGGIRQLVSLPRPSDPSEAVINCRYPANALIDIVQAVQRSCAGHRSINSSRPDLLVRGSRCVAYFL